MFRNARKGSVSPPPFPRATIPRSKNGTFYFAEKRNFLFCVDSAKASGYRMRKIGICGNCSGIGWCKCARAS